MRQDIIGFFVLQFFCDLKREKAIAVDGATTSHGGYISKPLKPNPVQMVATGLEKMMALSVQSAASDHPSFAVTYL